MKDILIQNDIKGLKFDNQALVFHGDKDDIVPLQDVVKYCNGRENIRVTVIKNADHHFKNQGEFERIVSEAVKFWETTYDRRKTGKIL